MDDYTRFILCTAGIMWAIWGILSYDELSPFAPSWRWKLFLYVFGGPLVWALAPYRAFRDWRLKTLEYMKLPVCGCGGDHKHACRPPKGGAR